MEGFTYYNMFDTKGIEYLIIIAFLILLIPFAFILNRQVRLKRKLHEAIGVLSSAFLRIPQGIYFSPHHTWAHLSRAGVASVGLDDLLLRLTGEVEVNYLKQPGERIAKGEPMLELLQEGKRLKVFSPISGTITGTNSALKEAPWELNEDPYSQGWIYRMTPSDWKKETGSLLLAEPATDWTNRELERFKDFLAMALPRYTPEVSQVALQDGGELREHVLTEMPEGCWRDFQREFLTPAGG